ncbi:MAG TPA: ATP phosphoribosyltransferase regulatory subunit, partial [Streptosporangiaceae bacterium]|nr:ATP phosphoribosyltransferase regulatory subunit [Streptosporangiaceae bacterium]
GAFFGTLDKLDKIGWEGVRLELASLGLSAGQVAGVEEKIRGLEGLPADKLAGALAEAVPGLAAPVIEDLVAVASCLDRLGGVHWEFDPTLVRGMGYYTGQVFEIVKPDVSFSLAGGGRYDKLIGKSLGHDVPACGFSLGFERIVDLLTWSPPRDAVAVLTEADVPVADALEVARELRSVVGEGRVVETVRRSGKFGAQLKRLEAVGFGGFVSVRLEDGAVVRGELRALGEF